MNVTEQILQFALGRKIGLNLDSTREDIEMKLGPCDDSSFNDMGLLYCGDLEIALLKDEDKEHQPFRNVGYYQFEIYKPRFYIPNFVDLTFQPRHLDMREVIHVFMEHSVWFTYPQYRLDEDDWRNFKTHDESKSFHFQKEVVQSGRSRYLLRSYYCQEI